jgi:hypothetical protein
LFFAYGDGNTRFLVYLDLDANSDLIAFSTALATETYLLTTNRTGSASYHDHELSLNPTNHVVTYRFDGQTIASWPGEPTTLQGVYWGGGSTKGQGSLNCHRAQFLILNTDQILAQYDAGTEDAPVEAPSPRSQGWTETTPSSPRQTVGGVSPDTTTSWVMQAKLTAPGGAAGDGFGDNLAIEGDTLVVGAYGDDQRGSQAGAAYVFPGMPDGGRFGPNCSPATAPPAHSSAGPWPSRLAASSSAPPTPPLRAPTSQGQYLFATNGSAWTEQARLTAREPGRDLFGACVALDGSTLVIGAEREPAHHLFVEDGTNWTELRVQSHADFLDAQVWQVAIHGETLVVGVANSDLGDGRVKVLEPDYADANLVRAYVRKFLYYPDATTGLFDKNLAAFRYKHLLYGGETNLVRARFDQMPTSSGTRNASAPRTPPSRSGAPCRRTRPACAGRCPPGHLLRSDCGRGYPCQNSGTSPRTETIGPARHGWWTCH